MIADRAGPEPANERAGRGARGRRAGGRRRGRRGRAWRWAWPAYAVSCCSRPGRAAPGGPRAASPPRSRATTDAARPRPRHRDRPGRACATPTWSPRVVAGGPAAIASLLRRGARWDRDARVGWRSGSRAATAAAVSCTPAATPPALEVHRVLEAALASAAVDRRAVRAARRAPAGPAATSGRLRHLTRGGRAGPQVTGADVDVRRTAAGLGPGRRAGHRRPGHAYARTTNPDGVDGPAWPPPCGSARR